MGKLADAWVEISAKDQQMVRDLDASRTKLTAFVSQAKSTLAVPLSIVGGAALGSFISGAITKASDLNETLSKTTVVFGGSSGGVIAQAEQLSQRFGLVRNEALAAASNIGLIAKASGLSEGAAADLASRFTRLAADAGSFFNVSLADALEKIRAGLVGESEPIRSFGVLLSEAAVQSEALSLGLVKSTKEMTEGIKVQARASLITKGLADATGDLERTADSSANQMKKLWGQLEEMQTQVGAKLLPALNELLPVATQLGTQLAEALDAEGTKSLISGLTEISRLLGQINSMSEKTGSEGFFGNLWRFGPVLGLKGMVGSVLDGGAQATMDANAKPIPWMADHEKQRKLADQAQAVQEKWVVDWGNAIAKDADAETRRLMSMPVGDAVAENARARGFKVEHIDAVKWKAAQGVGDIWNAPGKLADMGKNLLAAALGKAGGLAQAGMDMAGAFGQAVQDNWDKPRLQPSWSDPMSAWKQLQLDALKGNKEEVQKEISKKIGDTNTKLDEVKGVLEKVVGGTIARFVGRET